MKHMFRLILILAAPLAAPHWAQTEGGEAAKATDARATLERGAIAEEYDRDLERALILYAKAERAARAAGDEKTTKAAAEALARARARQAGAPAAAASRQDEALVQRIGELLSDLSTIPLGIGSEHPDWAKYRAVASDLAVYGDAVVPWLEELLQPTALQIGTWRVTLDTRMAARSLSRLKSEAAVAALARALQAKDPLVRHAVADELDEDEHRRLLELAARDAVAQVREVAIDSLDNLRLPEHLPLMEPEALRGNRDAIYWMVEVVPERLIELMLEGQGSAEFSEYGARRLERAELSSTQEWADAILRLARGLESSEARERCLVALQRFFGRNGQWQGATSDLRAHVQSVLLSSPADYGQSEAATALLVEVGGFDAFVHLSRELTEWPEGRSKQDTDWLRSAINGLRKRLVPTDFEQLGQLFLELPPEPGSDLSKNGSWHLTALDAMIALVKTKEVTAAAVQEVAAKTEGERAAIYHWVVRWWVETYEESLSQQPGLEELLPTFRRMLATSDPNFRMSALRGLGAAADIESLSKILEASQDELRGIKERAVEAIERFYRLDPQRTFDATVEAVVGRQVYPRATSFLEGRRLEAFQVLWTRLEDEEWRELAASHLVNNVWDPGTTEVVAEIYPVLKSSAHRSTAIGRFGDQLYEPAIPLLGQALEDPSPNVRAMARKAFEQFKSHREALEEFAAWSLGDRKAREQIDELIELLSADDPAVVLGAVKAIGAIRARAALPQLVRLLQQDDETLNAAVYAAIERIGS